MKILGTGLTGLVGSRIVELLHDTYTFENIGRAEGVDITNKEQITQAVISSNAEIVLHLAAMTDVKQAEAEKDQGEKSSAWQINVLGTEYIAQACQQSNKKLIYVSTDLVFDGEHTPENGYSEADQTNPLNWYGKTKQEGEKRVQVISSPWLILRIAYPYRAAFFKKDFVRVFLSFLQEEKQFYAIDDRIISPTFIDDIAQSLDSLLQHQATGIYHASGNTAISIYESAVRIAKTFGLSDGHIGKITRKDFLQGRLTEPYNSSLNIQKLEALGIHMHTFQEGLELVKEQQHV